MPPLRRPPKRLRREHKEQRQHDGDAGALRRCGLMRGALIGVRQEMANEQRLDDKIRRLASAAADATTAIAIAKGPASPQCSVREIGCHSSLSARWSGAARRIAFDGGAQRLLQLGLVLALDGVVEPFERGNRSA